MIGPCCGQTCGYGGDGCLGHGDQANVNKPQLVQKLLAVEVKDISVGHRHVAVITGTIVVICFDFSKFRVIILYSCEFMYIRRGSAVDLGKK